MTTGRTRRAGWAGAVFALGLAAAPAPGAGPVWWPSPQAVGGWEARAPVTRPQREAAPALTAAQLQAKATSAEAAGDWEAAFAALHDLHRLDRTAPGVRDRLAHALRRVQQVRRHRDPAFHQYAAGLPVADAVGLFGELAAKVPAMHADPVRSTPQQLWANGVEELARALDDAGFRRAALGDPPAASLSAFRAELSTVWSRRAVPDAREAKAVLKELVAAVLDVMPAARPSAVALEVVCGACAGLDEYTAFLPPSADASAGDWAAWGITVSSSGGGLLVTAVAVNSWADLHTDLEAGDRIIRVNGRPADRGDLFRSPAGNFHDIEFEPAGTILPAVARLPVGRPSVFGGRLVEAADGVGYLRVGEFRESTPRELAEEVAALRAPLFGARVLILDLRGNPGGSFLAGVEVARRLLPGGPVVGTQGQLGTVAGQVFASASGPAAIDLPLVVLIDADTASAAEVVAAALKGNNRAVLVGVPTFGKGAIQYPLRLSAADERAATVRLTIARLVGPHGVPFDGVGVSPHVVAGDPAAQWDAALRQAALLLRPTPMPMPMMPSADAAATVAP